MMLGDEDAVALKRFMSAHGTSGLSISAIFGGAGNGAADLGIGLADRDTAAPMAPGTWVEVGSKRQAPVYSASREIRNP